MVILFGDKNIIAFKISLGLYSHPLVVELFQSIQLRWRIEEIIYTKAVVNVARGEGRALEVVLSGGREANDLFGGIVCLGDRG